MVVLVAMDGKASHQQLSLTLQAHPWGARQAVSLLPDAPILADG
ncbi:hypothetical protein [Neiella litorisoli]|nr:hypothetical protein [Neiella litorisoli]